MPAPVSPESPGISLLEQFETATPETARERIRSFTARQLEALIREIEASRDVPSIFYEAMIKETIDQRLAEEGQTLEETRNRWQALRNRIERPPAPHDTPETLEQRERRYFFDTALDRVLPANWSQNRKRAVAGLTLGAAAILGWLLMRGDKGKEAAQESGGGLFKKLLYAALGFAGLYGLYKGATSLGWLKGVGKEEADRARHAQERAQEAEEQGREAAAQGAEVLSRETIEKGLALQYDVAESIGLSSPQPYLRKAGEILDISQRNPERIRMGLFFRCTHAATDDMEPYNALLHAVYEDFDSHPTDQQEEERMAARLIVGYLAKYEDRIRQNVIYTPHADPNDMTIGEALNLFVRLPSATSGMASMIALSIRNAIIDRKPIDLDAATQVFDDPKAFGEEVAHTYIGSLREPPLSASASQEEREQFQRECRSLARFCLTRRGVALNRMENDFPPEWVDGGREQAMARKLRDAVQSQESINMILAAAFVPRGQGTSEDRQVADALIDIVREGKISVSDAFQLYLIEQKGGGMLLTFKTLQIIKRYRPHEGLATDRYHLIIGRIEDAALSRGANVAALAAEFNMTSDQERELGNVVKYAREQTTHAITDFLEHVQATIRHHPFLATIIAVPVLGPSAYMLTKVVAPLWIKHQLSSINRFLDTYHGNPVAIGRLAQELKLGQNGPQRVEAAVNEVFAAQQKYERHASSGVFGLWQRRSARRGALDAIRQVKGGAIDIPTSKAMNAERLATSRHIASLHADAERLSKTIKDEKVLAQQIARINEQIEEASRDYLKNTVKAATNGATDNIDNLPRAFRKQILDHMIEHGGDNIAIPGKLRTELVKRGVRGRLVILAPLIAIRRLAQGEKDVSLAATAASTTIQLIPVAGTAYDVVSVFTGTDIITGERVGRLSSLGFAVAGLGCDVLTIVGIGAGARVVIKGGRAAARGARIAHAAKAAKWVRRGGAAFSIGAMTYEFFVDPKEVYDMPYE